MPVPAPWFCSVPNKTKKQKPLTEKLNQPTMKYFLLFRPTRPENRINHSVNIPIAAPVRTSDGNEKSFGARISRLASVSEFCTDGRRRCFNNAYADVSSIAFNSSSVNGFAFTIFT